MGDIKSFEDLEVWQKSHQLVIAIYKITKSFPREEQYGLTSQIRRAAVSIPNNIAEGFGRYTTRDFIHFLIQARGSLYELRYLMILSHELNILSSDIRTGTINEITIIGKMLNSMIKSLRQRLHTSNTNH